MFFKRFLKLALLQLLLPSGVFASIPVDSELFKSVENQFDQVFFNHFESFLKSRTLTEGVELSKILADPEVSSPPSSQDQVLNWRMFQDLFILNGDEFSKEASLIRLLPDVPQTLFGAVSLAKTLSLPLCTVDELVARKSFIDFCFSPGQGFSEVLESYRTNHDVCLSFIYKDHTKDDKSCLNPKHGLYWNPIAKTDGFLNSMVKAVFKMFKLEKIGIKSSSILKKEKKDSKDNLLTDQEKDLLDAFWITIVARWSKRMLIDLIFRIEDLQSTVEKLDNRWNFKCLHTLRKIIVDDPEEPGGSPRMTTSPSGNLLFGTTLRGPWWDLLSEPFRAEWERQRNKIYEYLGWRPNQYGNYVTTPRLIPRACLKLSKKTISPFTTFLRAFNMVYGVYSDISLWRALSSSLRRDFKAFEELLDLFYKVLNSISIGVKAGQLIIDPVLEAQLVELSQDKGLDLLYKRLKGFKVSFINFPRALQNYKLMYRSRPELVKLMAFFGQLEVLSCANSLSQRPEFCRPEFIAANVPQINFSGLWALQLGHEGSVKTNFGLGSKAKSVVITGSNAGGKSFFMRSVLTSVLLAQTLLIAPCQSISFTPFSRLYSFIKKEDDPANGRSLHWCECAEVVQFNKFIQALPGDRFALAIVDELFSGTSSDKGAFLFSNFIDQVKARPNVLGLYTTHGTKSLMALDFFSNSEVKFCKFGVNRNSSGAFTSYKYIPEEGVAGEFEETALDVARMAGLNV